MISSLSKPQILSKIFTDAYGRQFRLSFYVAIVDGKIKAHLLSATPLDRVVGSLPGGFSKPLCLPVICSAYIADTIYISNLNTLVSPFFSIEFLINSQPTRAPSSRGEA